ncbi:MAG: VCBS repeat-containing protein, partial [Bacteroidales bacterium]|nr:VCBS repeat-containing protein [Bacteroidales bacterium]
MNTGGIGARIDIRCGDKTYTQEFYPSRGYMSSMDHVLIFGLGDANSIDKLSITWPDMRVETLLNIGVDQTITLDNEDAKREIPETKPRVQTMFKSLNKNKPLHYKHIENDYIDFNKQPLLPYLLSTQGPYITEGDVNNDGLDDVFIGGARGYPGMLYLQMENGTFKSGNTECFETDKISEDLGVLFIDIDSDADLDLYVVSGGNEFSLASEDLQDRLYVNDGTGNFIKSENRIPRMLSSGSCVRSADIDNDGDVDLFVGGRLTPGLYPIAPRSYILENDGRGYFHDVTEEKNADLLNPGMVTDALWTDFSGDGLADLILVGKWMPVRLFLNTGSNLEEIKGQDWMPNSGGWWNSICSGDFDQDGDTDYLLGNMGLNFEIKPNPQEPV